MQITSTVPLGSSPYTPLIRKHDPTVVVEQIGHDLRVRTLTSQRRVPPKCRVAAVASGPRSVPYNEGCRRRLREAARGLLDPQSFVTVTFPTGVQVDDAARKRCWDKLRRWFVTRGVSGVMCLEFTKRGTPHFHVMIDRSVVRKELKAIWASILGRNERAVHCHSVEASQIYDRRGLVKYMAKPMQKVAPPGVIVSRWWGAFGVQKPTKPKLVTHGRRSEMDSLLWSLWRQRPEGKPPQTFDGNLPARFNVWDGVDSNWKLMEGLGLVNP